MKNIAMTPIQAFKDNYIWAFSDVSKKQIWVVDPGDAFPVIQALKKSDVCLAGILLTHHHRDHSGGIDELIRFAGNIPVYGSHLSPIKSVTHHLREGDEIIAGSYCFKILEIPGHTLDHIAFYADEILFCGDTLFSAGCGRLFEGTPSQLFSSLTALSQLGDATKIYCGHEYTAQNLNFARHVEPNNLDIANKIEEVKKTNCTLPSLLRDEKKFNPFLRCETPDVIAAVERHVNKKLNNPVEVFACLREWKNNF